MLIGVPVAVSLGTSTVLTMIFFTDIDIATIPQLIFDGINKIFANGDTDVLSWLEIY